MERDIKDMGEEEIRARMELEKLDINKWHGFIFSLLLGAIIFSLHNLNNPDPVLKFGSFLLWFSVAIFVIIRETNPSEKRFLELAKELDRRKKKE